MSNQNIYPKISNYYNTDVFNNKFLDVMVYRPIPALVSDVYYQVPIVYQYRPDLLAYDLYGDSKLWWVFASRNPNVLGPDPVFNLVAGISIYLPQQTTIQQALGI